MYSLKEKVEGSLSRLLSDSPHHFPPSPTLSPSPSPSSDHSQETWYSKGLNSLSSIFAYIIPPARIDEPGSDDHGNTHELKPIRSSLPDRWKNKKFELEDESLDGCKEYTITYISEDLKKVCEDNKEILANIGKAISPHDWDKGRGLVMRSGDFDEFHEARDQMSPVNASPNLSDDSAFINYDLFEFLGYTLPNIVKGCQWTLMYSTSKHGISLRTLIRKSNELPGPCLLITGDRQGAVFGAMLECPLKPTPRRKYQGTNQTFVFTTKYGEPRLFRPTGANRYYYICLYDLLAFGGGDKFALCLEGDLLNGSSRACETFGNLCLAHNEDFELKNVELWGFKHAYSNT